MSADWALSPLATGHQRRWQLTWKLCGAQTTAPFGVNLFVAEPYRPDASAVDAYRRSLEPVAASFDVSLGEPRWDDDAWQAKLEARS